MRSESNHVRRAFVSLGRRLSLSSFVACCSLAAPARAQLPPNGAPIVSSNYRVDLARGPVLTSSAVTGLGGAYVAIAEGTEGNSFNPAAPAVRVPYSFSHFDYDLDLGFTLPLARVGNDFFNTGRDAQIPASSKQNVVFGHAGVNLQFGTWGFGLNLEGQDYVLDGTVGSGETANVDDQLRASFGLLHLLVARSFSRRNLVLGVGLRASGLTVNHPNPPPDTKADLFETTGAGLELGLLWKPIDQQFRAGAAFYSAISTQASPDGAVRPNAVGDRVWNPESGKELYLPDQVALPWKLDVGVAVQLGARPLNPRWIDPRSLLHRLRRRLARRADRRDARWRAFEAVHAPAGQTGAQQDAERRKLETRLEREAEADELVEEQAELAVERRLRQRYARMSRSHILITSSLNITGPVDNAVGIESFISRTVDRSGQDASVAPSVGVETEPIPHWLRLRQGTYREPTRFDNGKASPRWHATYGFTLKLLPWTVFGLFPDGSYWRLTGATDVARNYFGWGLGIGVWH